MKSRAHRLSKESAIRQMNRAPTPFPLANPTEDSVVRADEELFATFNQNRVPVRADSGIDNGDVNCAGRKVLVTSKESKCRSVDILRWNLVSYIDDLRVGIARKDDALHRSNKVIPRTKVGQEGDRRFQVSGFKFQVSSFKSLALRLKLSLGTTDVAAAIGLFDRLET
jgi:hypothetical protein